MDSPMLKLLKIKNPDKQYPVNVGKKWTDEEDELLISELDKKNKYRTNCTNTRTNRWWH